MEIDPLSLAPRDRYKLLIGAVVPRPIAFVSTAPPGWKWGDDPAPLNVAPFSFFAGVGSDPMSLLFCPSNRPDGGEKDTLANIESTGQFVVNVVTEAIDRRAVACAEELPYGRSEFALAGLSPARSAKVAPPRVGESPVSFECERTHVVRLNEGAPGGGNVVIGRVVHVHADDRVIDGHFHIDPAKLAAVGRMAGLTYCRTRDRYDIPWGIRALEK
jgi:flavin reductase (DIM6/NTAB) family NADH-FMN oxidoreductase RutF